MRFIVGLMMKVSRVVVNRVRCPDYSDGEIQSREIGDEEAA